MGRTKCNVSSYDPSGKDNRDENYIEPQAGGNRQYDAYVIEPEATKYTAMEVDGTNNQQRYDDYCSTDYDYCGAVEKYHPDTTKPQHNNKSLKKKLKYDEYEPSLDGSLSDEVYIVRQNWGYCSILFSLAQTIIMVLMMVQCGIAPLKINPMIGPYPDVLSEWGAKNAVLILDEGEWWRLLTPVLLHAGIIHLLCNVAVQLETGVFFEKEWGSARWLVIYLVSALGSSILSVVAMPDALSVGSSGAVMGLFGGKLSEVVMRACERARTKQDLVGQQVRKEQCCAVSCSVVVIMLFSFIPYVDWAAHLGGLASGILVGIFIFACEIESVLWRVLWTLGGMAATIVCFTMALTYMYSGAIEPMEELRDVCAYYMEALGAEGFECQCQRSE